MSVVAFDGRTLAADKRAGVVSVTVKKIRRIGDLVAGGVGSMTMVAELFAWVERGRKVDEFTATMRADENGSELLVIERGQILKYEQSPHCFVIEDPFYAIGSGRKYALAAMALGRTAVQAVELASTFDPACGNGVDVLKIAS